MSWQIAGSASEARQQHHDGYGYTSRADAETALASPEIDSVYRSKLQLFEVVSIHPPEQPRKAGRPRSFGADEVRS